MNATCPFCELPRDRILYEDHQVVALWDGFPVSPGHALIVPRRHVPTWFEASIEEQAAIVKTIERVRDEILRRYQPDGFNIGINVGEAAGQTVFHLHLHVIPRYRGDVPNPRGGVRRVIPHRADYSVARPSGLDFVSVAPHTRQLVRGDIDPLLPHLCSDLDRANNADLAISFILRSGVRLIQEHLRDFLRRKGRLRIITGDYLDVTEPEALRELLDLEGDITLRVFEARSTSFHPKSFEQKVFFIWRCGKSCHGNPGLVFGKTMHLRRILSVCFADRVSDMSLFKLCSPFCAQILICV